MKKKSIIIFILFFIITFALFIWPVGFISEDTSNYLTGEGSWTPEYEMYGSGYCQEFSPQYRNLQSICLYFTHLTEQAPTEGKIFLAINDAEDNLLFNTNIACNNISFNSYHPIETNLKLSPGKSYFLTINLSSEIEQTTRLSVCSQDYPMPENMTLSIGDTTTNEQLLTMYNYKNAIPLSRALKAGFLLATAAFILGFGLLTKNIYLHQGIGMFVLLLTPYILGQRLELVTITSNYLLPNAPLGNMIIMYLFEAVILLCTLSIRTTIILTEVLLTVLYSANYFVYTFRGTPFKFNDLFAARTAAQIVNNYDLTPNTHLAMCWCIALVFLAVGIRMLPCKLSLIMTKKPHLITRLLCFCTGVALLFSMGHVLLYTNFLQEKGYVALHGFDQHMTYQFNGYLISSCFDIQNNRIEKPENYSIDAVENILATAQAAYQSKTVSCEMPHIILIMNESFSDLTVLGNVKLTQDNLSFFNNLSDNTIRGYTNASVLGGGTANSEFEVFTGCSMGLLPSSYYAYLQCINKPLPSLVSMAKEAGYTTYAMHPETAHNWNRRTVYSYLGFDNTLWKNDFENAEYIHNGVSDLETYKKIISLYENKQPGEKLFLFDLTMQNHGGYTESSVTPYVSTTNLQNTTESDIYLSIMDISDQALKYLIEYFEAVDEPTIICLFGDHQPQFSDERFYDSIYSQTEGLTDADILMNQYKTPFIIWANYDIEEQNNLDISMNYLGVLLAETAGLEISPYFQFLLNQMEDYPIITVNGYVDSIGTYSPWDETSPFTDYNFLQYNYLFDQP